MNKLGARYGINGKDEWYTPTNAVIPITKYIRGGYRVLCPFDTEKSNFVAVLKEGWDVQYSHIFTGTDFFELDKPDVDYIISNPPFSRRDDVLQRLYEWGIPFAMIFNANGLFDSKVRMRLAKTYGAEVLYMYPRVKFSDNKGNGEKSPFQSCYWCYKILPEKIMFEYTETKWENTL